MFIVPQSSIIVCNIIIIVNCILACITTVYNIFNDMRWNFFDSLLSIILPLIRHFSMLKL